MPCDAVAVAVVVVVVAVAAIISRPLSPLPSSLHEPVGTRIS